MPVPIDPHDINVSTKQLYELLKTKGFTPGYYASVQAEIDARADRTKAIEKFAQERKKAKKTKEAKKLDARSVKHAAVNSGAVGAPTTIAGSWMVYKELKAEGLAPSPETVWWAFTQLSDFAQVVIVLLLGIAIMVACATLADRYHKKFD
jgi:hypothetical protein